MEILENITRHHKYLDKQPKKLKVNGMNVILSKFKKSQVLIQKLEILLRSSPYKC